MFYEVVSSLGFFFGLFEPTPTIRMHKPSLESPPPKISLNLNIRHCEEYPGGNTELARDFERAFEKGVSCLTDTGISGKEVSNKLLQTLTLPENPVFVRCGKSKEAFRDLQDRNEPSIRRRASSVAWTYRSGETRMIALHLPSLLASANKAQSVLFHEMVHVAGYKHAQGVDWAYLSEIACFSKGRAEAIAAPFAKSLIRDYSDWTSPGHQNGFAQLMIAYGNSSIAADSAWAAAFQQPVEEKPKPRNPTNALWAAFSEIQSEQAVFGSVIKMAAVRGLVGASNELKKELWKDGLSTSFPNEDEDTEKKRDLARFVASMIGAVLQSDAKTLNTLFPYFLQARATACPILSTNELNEFIDVVKLTQNKVAALTISKLLGLTQIWTVSNFCPFRIDSQMIQNGNYLGPANQKWKELLPQISASHEYYDLLTDIAYVAPSFASIQKMALARTIPDLSPEERTILWKENLRRAFQNVRGEGKMAKTTLARITAAILGSSLQKLRFVNLQLVEDLREAQKWACNFLNPREKEEISNLYYMTRSFILEQNPALYSELSLAWDEAFCDRVKDK